MYMIIYMPKWFVLVFVLALAAKVLIAGLMIGFL